MRGIVDRLAIERGFGFLVAEKKEFFFHRSGLKGVDFDELAPGTEVEFEVQGETEGDRPREHPRAVNIRLADAEVPATDHELMPPGKVA